MASVALHGLFDIQQSSTSPKEPSLPSPPIAHWESSPSKASPSSIELDSLCFGERYNGPPDGSQTPRDEHSGGIHTPKTPRGLEMSRAGSLAGNEAFVRQTWNNPPKNKRRILCCCLIYFGHGINDSGGSSLSQLRIEVEG